jgi:hypothetical protein
VSIPIPIWNASPRGALTALAAAGAPAWVAALALLRPDWAAALLLLAAFVCVPLGLALLAEESTNPAAWRVLAPVHPPPALLLAVAFAFPPGPTAVLTVPWLLFTLFVASLGLLRLRQPGARTTADVCLSAGMVFLAVGGGWAFLSRLGARPLGFSPVILLLTGVHFHYAGFVLPLLTGILARTSPGRLSRLAGVCVMAGVPLVAVGITLGRGWPAAEGPPAWFLSAACLLVGYLQLQAAHSGGGGVRSLLLGVSALSLGAGMILAAVYAVGVVSGRAWLSVDTMIPWHGSLNAVGFAVPGLLAWHLGPGARG